MLFNWLNARKASAVGAALADDFFFQTTSGSSGSRHKGSNSQTQGQEVHKFLEKFLQRVDRDARPLQLNIFQRAKLANSFKWRLREKGVASEIVDELTRELVLRLSANKGSALPGASASTSRPTRGKVAALLTKGNERMAQGDFGAAMSCYQDLLSVDPRHAVARNNLGAALSKLGRYQEAQDQFRRAIGIKDGYPDAHYNLAAVLQSTGRLAESEMPLRRVLKLRPSHLAARISLGMTFVLLGRVREAKECFEKALRVAPRNVSALVGIGQVAALEGRFAEAEGLYRGALEVDPKAPNAYAGLVGLRKMTPADGAWFERAQEIADSGLALADEINVRFAIGKYCDDVGDFRRAFRSYQRANELHKTRVTDPYNRAEHARFVDDLIRVYTPETVAGVGAVASDSAQPVFVVGMPRSGTSLVEQIIASHPAARGAGELDFWTAVVRKHETVIRHELLAEPLREKLAAQYLRVLAGDAADAARVVDKAPVNADYLGVIHSVLPNARMIYLRRDPIDTCLSCYFQQFPAGQNFTMDLAELADYYREHQRLVAHWRRVLPSETLLEVPYAELIAEQEKWTRRILDFLGLPWDERCLDFQKTERTVTTASTWQVRQKIYTSSVGRWRNYEKFIGPLLGLKDLDG
jgi:tetratricopeptide (TPR) repeat protein